MSMKKVTVVTHIGSVFEHDVDHLHNISIFEEQCASRAFTPLLF